MTKHPQDHMGCHSVACHGTIYATKAYFQFRSRSQEILPQTLAADTALKVKKSTFWSDYLLNGGKIQNWPRWRKLY